jgi:hypothetical protein
MTKSKSMVDRLWRHENTMLYAESRMTESLRIIRDRRLYRAIGYQTFREYCMGEWKMVDLSGRFMAVPIAMPREVKLQRAA